LFAVPILVVWLRMGFLKKTKLGCEKIFIARSHTKHHWSWSGVILVLSMGNLHNKLDEEKSTYAGIFTPAFLLSFLRLVKKCSKPVCTC
jgi:hypothetical protein